MELLYNNRSIEDQNFIKEVCNDILSIPLEDKEESNDFCFIFVEGRPDIEINKLEHFACFRSCKVFSQFNYPIYCFVNNTNNFLNNDQELIKKYNIQIIKIEPITSQNEYTQFCIKKLYFLLPPSIDKVLTVSADSFLIKSGVEDYLQLNNWNFVGAPFRHLPSIEYLDGMNLKGGETVWKPFFNAVYGFNGGMSYRRSSFCRTAVIYYGKFNLREKHSDGKYPNEDLFYSAINNGTCINIPTREEALKFAIDPMDKEDYNKKDSFSFHYFSAVNPWKNKYE